MTKERIKSFILILLILNSVQLTLQLWFDNNLFGNGQRNGTGIFSFFNIGNDELNESKIYAKATRPRRVIVNGGGAREVYSIDSDEYQMAMELVNGMVEKMKQENVAVSNISYEHWKNLFKGKSLYIDYGYSFDYNGLNDLFGIKNSRGGFSQFENASGYIITPDVVTNTCTVHFFDSLDNSVYEHKFTCDGSDILAYIEECTYGRQQNDTFAFEINLDTISGDSQEVQRMVSLSPLSLLSISVDGEKEEKILAENIFAEPGELERFAKKTLEIFGYNPSSLRKTIQKNGTIVYVENNATIKYHYDGTVEYSAVSRERGMRISNSLPTCNTAISDTLTVVKQLWNASGLDAESLNLQLNSTLADNKTGKYDVEFNNMYNGKVINYTNVGNSAVSATVENGYITAFTMHLAKLSSVEEALETMPVLESIDMLYSQYGESKMIIDDVYKCYNIQDGDNLQVKWAFKVRGDDRVLVAGESGFLKGDTYGMEQD